MFKKKDFYVVIVSEYSEESAIRQKFNLPVLILKETFHLSINSMGGYISGNLAIYDVMKWLPCEVHTYALASPLRWELFCSPLAASQPYHAIGDVGGTSADIAAG